MNRFFIIIFAFLLLHSCSPKQKAEPVSSLEAGRLFISSIMNGSFEESKSMLLPNPKNNQAFDLIKSNYNKKKDTEQNKLSNMDYVIHDYEEINDSVSNIEYSYQNTTERKKISLTKKDGKWLVNICN